MSEASFRNHSPGFVNPKSDEELVEISLNSDTEEDRVEHFQHFHNSQLIEIEPVFPPQKTSVDLTSFIDSDQTSTSPKSGSPGFFSETACQDLDNDEDFDEDLKFNLDLADEMRRQCTILSPSLVRAITSDIEEIRRSLSSANPSPPCTTNLLNLLPPKQHTLSSATAITTAPAAHQVDQPSEQDCLFGGKQNGSKKRGSMSR